MAPAYIPDRGDLVWLEFTPQTGSEQAGRRPALVISPKSYNGKVGLALFCPVTSRVKGYPFEVLLPEGGESIAALLINIVGIPTFDSISNKRDSNSFFFVMLDSKK